MFTSKKKNLQCSRCNLTWSKKAFFKLSLQEQKRFLSGNSCPLCCTENWSNGHYLGD